MELGCSGWSEVHQFESACECSQSSGLGTRNYYVVFNTLHVFTKRSFYCVGFFLKNPTGATAAKNSSCMEYLVLSEFRKYIIHNSKLQKGNVESGKITSGLTRPHFNLKVLEIIDVATKPETNLDFKRSMMMWPGHLGAFQKWCKI